MLPDDKFLELLNQLTHAHKVQLDAAFERGRAAGRREMRAELRDEMRALRYLFEEEANDPDPSDQEEAEIASPEESDPDQGHRAPPGSVKPIILDLIHGQPGLTTVEIRAMTKLKPNSIRGTLWTLSAQDKVIERRNGRWYPTWNGDEAAGANPEERTLTASNAGPSVADGETSDQPTHDGPEAVEGKVAHEKIDIFS